MDKNREMQGRENEKREGEEGQTRDDDISTLVVCVCVLGVYRAYPRDSARKVPAKRSQQKIRS